jgi:hypothetical protein
MSDAKVRRVKLTDLLPDRRNANLHSERGTYMVGRSVEKLGLGRGILVDKDEETIAGNLTLEQAIDAGFEDGILVETDGKTLVITQRTDMDLDDPETGAREMAYADNRAAVVSINFDPEEMKIDFDAGLDLGDWWQDFELEEMVNGPTIPDPQPQQEPELESDHLIEIRCSRSALVMIQDKLNEWANIKDVSINIS